MGTQIEGSGSGRKAGVTINHELNVAVGTAFQAATIRGDAYLWFATQRDVVAGETLFMIRNDSGSQDLVIDSVELLNGNVAQCVYDFHIVTVGYASAGTLITGTNMNLDFGNTAAVDARADETGNTQGTVFKEYRAFVVDAYSDFPNMGLILKPGTAFGIDQITESDSGAVSVKGYFIDK